MLEKLSTITNQRQENSKEIFIFFFAIFKTWCSLAKWKADINFLNENFWSEEKVADLMGFSVKEILLLKKENGIIKAE